MLCFGENLIKSDKVFSSRTCGFKVLRGKRKKSILREFFREFVVEKLGERSFEVVRCECLFWIGKEGS